MANLRIRMGASLTSLFLLAALGGMGGCASTVRQVSATATPVVVHTGLQEANTPQSQQQLHQLANSPGFKDAGQSVGVGVGIGLFEQANKYADQFQAAQAANPQSPGGAMGASTTQPGTQASSQPTTQPTSQPTTQPGGIIGLLSGSGGGFINSTIQEAFAAAYNPQFREGEMKLSEAIGEGFVTGMIAVINKQGPAIGDTVRTQIGPITQMIIKEQLAPAIADTIRNQIAPVITDTLQHQLAPAALQVWKEGAAETVKLTVRPDIQPDVVQNAHNASLGASRGTHDALVESGFLTPTGELAPHVKLYLWTVIVLVAAGVVLLFSLLVILNVLALSILRGRGSRASFGR